MRQVAKCECARWPNSLRPNIYLIQDMKEKDYPFNKFTFLDKYDLDNLFVIYQKTNIILKKKNKISMISQGKTIIDIMANISYDVVEKLVNSKYK